MKLQQKYIFSHSYFSRFLPWIFCFYAFDRNKDGHISQAEIELKIKTLRINDLNSEELSILEKVENLNFDQFLTIIAPKIHEILPYEAGIELNNTATTAINTTKSSSTNNFLTVRKNLCGRSSSNSNISSGFCSSATSDIGISPRPTANSEHSNISHFSLINPINEISEQSKKSIQISDVPILIDDSNTNNNQVIKVQNLGVTSETNNLCNNNVNFNPVKVSPPNIQISDLSGNKIVEENKNNTCTYTTTDNTSRITTTNTPTTINTTDSNRHNLNNTHFICTSDIDTVNHTTLNQHTATTTHSSKMSTQKYLNVDIHKSNNLNTNQPNSGDESPIAMPYREFYSIFDLDGDGFISKEEIKKVMNELGEDITDQDINHMLFGKEEISYKELEGILKSYCQEQSELSDRSRSNSMHQKQNNLETNNKNNDKNSSKTPKKTPKKSKKNSKTKKSESMELLNQPQIDPTLKNYTLEFSSEQDCNKDSGVVIENSPEYQPNSPTSNSEMYSQYRVQSTIDAKYENSNYSVSNKSSIQNQLSENLGVGYISQTTYSYTNNNNDNNSNHVMIPNIQINNQMADNLTPRNPVPQNLEQAVADVGGSNLDIEIVEPGSPYCINNSQRVVKQQLQKIKKKNNKKNCVIM